VNGNLVCWNRLGCPLSTTPVLPTVLHVATTDLGDGAGISASRLHLGLKLLGVESHMAVTRRRSQRSDVHEIRRPLSTSRLAPIAELAADAIEVALNQVLPQNAFSLSTRDLLDSPLVRRCSIFNLHALHRRRRHLPADLCRSLSRLAPVVWTMHDMWAFTGHCTFAYSCERWRQACGACPMLDDHVKLMLDSTARSLRFKRRAYADSDFVVVAPSRWLAQQARTSPLLSGKRVEHIPYGIDLDVFHPIDKPLARVRLSLPQETPILLLSAFSFSDRRKGVRFAWEALTRQRSASGVVLVMGDGTLPSDLPRGWEVRRLGFLADPAKQAEVYAAADALVFPSLADNLPNTVMEAMACGAAVLAFDVGGVPELVRSGETGWLAPAGDAEGLASGIEWLFAEGERLRRVQHEAAAKMQQGYGLRVQAERYLALYRDLLERRGRRVPLAAP
jgi:glycosyltransferase involved in cell wall biosynthesis